MQRRVNASDGGEWFDDLVRQVAEEGESVAIARDGKPAVVLLSFAEYERLRAAAPTPTDWRALVDQARTQVRAHLGDKPFPSVVDTIREMREERDDQLLDRLRRRQSRRDAGVGPR